MYFNLVTLDVAESFSYIFSSVWTTYQIQFKSFSLPRKDPVNKTSMKPIPLMTTAELSWDIFTFSHLVHSRNTHCVKSVRIWSFSGPCFTAFGLNTESYGLSLRIQSECGKILTRKSSNTDTFHTVAQCNFYNIFWDKITLQSYCMELL